MNFEKYKIKNDDEYKKIKLYKLDVWDKNLINSKRKDFYAITNFNNMKNQYQLINNINILMDHMHMNMILHELKVTKEMMINADNTYKSTFFDLYYKKLISFYPLLSMFILQMCHIFYWDDFIIERNYCESTKSGMNLQNSLKLSMKIGSKIMDAFQQVLHDELKEDKLINNIFKGVHPDDEKQTDKRAQKHKEEADLKEVEAGKLFD